LGGKGADRSRYEGNRSRGQAGNWTPRWIFASTTWPYELKYRGNVNPSRLFARRQPIQSECYACDELALKSYQFIAIYIQTTKQAFRVPPSGGVLTRQPTNRNHSNSLPIGMPMSTRELHPRHNPAGPVNVLGKFEAYLERGLPIRLMYGARKTKKWSQRVTETGNALDLEEGSILPGRPAQDRPLAQAIRRAQPPPQERSIPLGYVNADFLHKSSRA
jgi:hypothetical protein